MPDPSVNPATPGLLSEYTIVPCFKGDSPSADRDRLNDSTRRTFKLSALLGKHSWRAGMVRAVHEKEEGGSFILASDGAAATKLDTPVGEMLLFHNRNRELSLVEFTCEATSLNEAKQKFSRFLNPFLDQLSYRANIPIHILERTCRDEVHQIQSVEYTTPH